MRRRPLLGEALRYGARDFLTLLPRIAIGMIGSGFIAELLPQHLVLSWLGPGTGAAGLILATCAGALTWAGRWSVSRSTAALKSGAGAPQVIAYTIAWALFVLPRVLVFEIPFDAARARGCGVRVAVSLPLPFLAAWTAMLVGKP